MKLLKIYKENKALIKENTKLKTELKSEEERYSKRIEIESILRGRIDDLLDKQILLQKEIVKLSEKNY